MPGFLGHELGRHGVWEHHEEWRQQDLCAWNEDEEAERDEFDDICFDLLHFLGLKIFFVFVLVSEILALQLSGDYHVFA